jgi:hypothetical protein
MLPELLWFNFSETTSASSLTLTRLQPNHSQQAVQIYLWPCDMYYNTLSVLEGLAIDKDSLMFLRCS